MLKTLIILDWDDTLFPTSWIIKNSINVDDTVMKEEYIKFFSKLDKTISNLLDKCIKKGEVAIITNATIKWVIASSNLLPNTQNIMKKKIIVISARDKYGNKMPGHMKIWKKLIFKQLTLRYFINKNLIENIISMGDAEYEFNALKNLYNEYNLNFLNINYGDKPRNKRLLKSIRFIQSPTYEALLDQLEVLNECIDTICSNTNHMDLKFETK